jgi:hypothetical protein
LHPEKGEARRQCVWLGITQRNNIEEFKCPVEKFQMICTRINPFVGPADQQMNKRNEMNKNKQRNKETNEQTNEQRTNKQTNK